MTAESSWNAKMIGIYNGLVPIRKIYEAWLERTPAHKVFITRTRRTVTLEKSVLGNTQYPKFDLKDV